MDQKMFCFQCEQTAGGKGCTGGAGVCGKSSTVANLQDELTGALIGVPVRRLLRQPIHIVSFWKVSSQPLRTLTLTKKPCIL